MSSKIEQSPPGSGKIIFVFFSAQLSTKLSEVINAIDPLYTIQFYDLKPDIPDCTEMLQNNTLRNNVEKINYFYEKKRLNINCHCNNIILISDDPVIVPFLTWLHDFAPKFNASILFALNSCFWRSYSSELNKLIYDASSVVSPVMMILSDKNRYGKKFCRSIANNNFSSMILNDVIGTPSLGDNITSFIESCSVTAIEDYPFIHADKRGFTYEERLRLGAVEKNVFKRLYWFVQRILLKIAGFFSDGIKTGIEHGFDSGSMLDYVYRNQPGGRGPVGKFFDKLYLNSIPWRGARYREKYVRLYLADAVEKFSKAGGKVNIIDIAAGHAKYLFDLSDKDFENIDSVLLRDYDESNCTLVNNILRKRKLQHLITYEKGDAFSALDLASLPTDRTIAVASGFYELFDNNKIVLQSLKGVFNTLEEEGIFIYTNILWHPRHTYMARVMTRHNDKQAWLIRRRFQQEIDDLVRLAGFTKLGQKVDPWGIFSVSIAKKCTPGADN